MNRIELLSALGQSLWYDNIERRLLQNGELEELVRRGDIRGITSNPSIFQKAIANSKDYDDSLKTMAWAGWQPKDILDRLMIEDIRKAADLFLPLYQETDGKDGYVSIEVNPLLANSTQETSAEALRLWKTVDHPNTMVKIPATEEGIPAIRQSIAAGININITLIFSLERYEEVMNAYLSGLEDRLANQLPIDRISSVASFFVSRVDTKVDDKLNRIIAEEGNRAPDAQKLLGKAAVANANLAYARFREIFTSERYQRLQEKGAHLQRPLWASTSTKNPAYRDVMYVEDLIGPNTVNTVPPQTLDAIRDHGEIKVTLNGSEEAKDTLARLDSLGISMSDVTLELEKEGVKAFIDAYRSLSDTIEKKVSKSIAELGSLASKVKTRVDELETTNFVQRIWAKDPTLWTSDIYGQNEIRNRLGWLALPLENQKYLKEIISLADDCLKSGYENVLLLGMGGSSLAPEVFQQILDTHPEMRSHPGLRLRVLDSTHPQQIMIEDKRNPAEKTLFIVSSKSGTTTEVNTLLSYFWDRAQRLLGENTGEHYIAITDPGTPLEFKARELGFRKIISGDTTIGGRFSALSPFGLVPAALLGLDVYDVLAQAKILAEQCLPGVPPGCNPGLVLGAILGEAAVVGKNKLTIIADSDWRSFGAWLEQLIAESSGKGGRGILPVDEEPGIPPNLYRDDRIFIYLRSSGSQDDLASRLGLQGLPVVTFDLAGPDQLGSEFYRWCFAISTACAILGINAFDQPDVQDNKTRTQQKLAAIEEGRSLGESNPSWQDKEIKIYTSKPGIVEDPINLVEVIVQYCRQARPGDYVALNAYLPRTPEVKKSLQELRRKIMVISQVPVTLGFGPRFLHSTGQLHKGGSPNALFIQITAEPGEDIIVPGAQYTFGTLIKAQAIGDFEALQARGRRVMRIHLASADPTLLENLIY